MRLDSGAKIDIVAAVFMEKRGLLSRIEVRGGSAEIVDESGSIWFHAIWVYARAARVVKWRVTLGTLVPCDTYSCSFPSWLGVLRSLGTARLLGGVFGRLTCRAVGS